MAELRTDYRIMALGPFAPVPDGKFKPQFVPVDLYSLDEAIAAIAPVLYLPLSTELCPEGAVTLRFNSMKDFKPGQIVKNVSSLDTATTGFGGGPARPSVAKASAVDDILSMVDGPDTAPAPPAGGAGKDAALKAIFSDEFFSSMESAWRGVQTLVKQADIKGFQPINLSISPVSRSSLSHVLGEIKALPQGQMANLLLVDLGFDASQPSVELMERVVAFADEMMVPTCVWLGSQFFRIDSWSLMKKIPYINHHLEEMSYVKFKKLQDHGGASWTMACCNKFALRNAHEFEPAPLMASPVWAAGILIAKSIGNTGWPMAFTNYVDCFIENLPLFSIDSNVMAATQGLFSEDRIAQLLEAGITPVVGAKNKDIAFMPKAISLAGEPIRFQMVFNRIISVLMTLREDGESWVDPETAVTQGIKQLFVRSGQPEPGDLAVSVGPSDASPGRQKVSISFTPPRAVLAAAEKIDFSFLW